MKREVKKKRVGGPVCEDSFWVFRNRNSLFLLASDRAHHAQAGPPPAKPKKVIGSTESIFNHATSTTGKPTSDIRPCLWCGRKATHSTRHLSAIGSVNCKPQTQTLSLWSKRSLFQQLYRTRGPTKRHHGKSNLWHVPKISGDWGVSNWPHGWASSSVSFSLSLEWVSVYFTDIEFIIC
jgi:hypothetical protein